VKAPWWVDNVLLPAPETERQPDLLFITQSLEDHHHVWTLSHLLARSDLDPEKRLRRARGDHAVVPLGSNSLLARQDAHGQARQAAASQVRGSNPQRLGRR